MDQTFLYFVQDCSHKIEVNLKFLKRSFSSSKGLRLEIANTSYFVTLMDYRLIINLLLYECSTSI